MCLHPPPLPQPLLIFLLFPQSNFLPTTPAKTGLKWQVKGRRPLKDTSHPAQAPHLFGLLLPSLLLGEEL